MAELKRTFTGGKMDKDTDERIVQNGLYREALNISISTSEDSDVGAAQNILGNTRVTRASQYVTQANVDNNHADPDLIGKNYHVGAAIDKQSNKLYRFIHTESPGVDRGIWMDRILEFDTSKKINEDWDTKEFAVFVDIFKVKFPINNITSVCTNGTGIPNKSLVQMNDSGVPLFPFVNQVRWGMRAEDESGNNLGTVEDVYYNGYDDSGTTVFGFVLNQNNISLNIQPGEIITLYGDRNLNFGDTVNGLRNITGVNIVDGLLYWTDNISEPKKLNIERSKMGCDSATWQTSTGRGGNRIDDFIQHTLLVVDEDNPRDIIIDESTCITEEGCLDPNALNYDATALYDCLGADPTDQNYTQDAGWDDCCVDEIPGCTDQSACNYDANANFNNGSCCYIEGCTDPTACNYNVNACCDDGSCTFAGCQQGCTDPGADNHDPNADIDDGSCTYQDVWILSQDTSCECIQVGANTNIKPTYADEASCEAANQTALTTGCCDPNVIYGCTDPIATNYAAHATCGCNAEVGTIQNGLGAGQQSTGVGCDAISNLCDGPGGNECCVYTVSGCMDPLDANFDPIATTNDPSQCTGVFGCTDPLACNYDCATIINEFSITPCNDGVNTDDGTCEYEACEGCMDPLANNYNPNATRTDNSCTYEPTFVCNAMVECIEVIDGSGNFASREACEQVCVMPSWDCFSGTCLDPGTGNGQFASENVCNAACVDPGGGASSTFNCDNGGCVELIEGDNGYPGTYANLGACQAACYPQTFDCDGQGTCSENFLGTGNFLDLNTCNQYCQVPVSWNCDGNGSCYDPGDGTGAYTDDNSGGNFGDGLTACQAACTVPVVAWTCDGNNNCVQDSLGGFATQQACYDNINDCYDPLTTVFGCMDDTADNYDPNATVMCDDAMGTSGCDNSTVNCQGPGNNECCEYTLTQEWSVGLSSGGEPKYECQETTTGNAIDNIIYFASQWDCEDASPYIGCRDPQSMTYNVYAHEEGSEPVVNSNKACYYPDNTTAIIPDGNTAVTTFNNQPVDLRGTAWTFAHTQDFNGSYTISLGGYWDYSGGDHGFSTANWQNNEYDQVAWTGDPDARNNNNDPDYFYGSPNYARNLAVYIQGEIGVTWDLENGGTGAVGDGTGGWWLTEVQANNDCSARGDSYAYMNYFAWYGANVLAQDPSAQSNAYQNYCGTCSSTPADGDRLFSGMNPGGNFDGNSVYEWYQGSINNPSYPCLLVQD